MRTAVVSDIHANLHALEAVLADVEVEAPDAVWCLGDVVGYGPRPNECCSLVRERADLCLVGNHDLVALGEGELEAFNPDAAEAAEWTRGVLSADSEEFLRGLRPSASSDGVELYHGSPRDPVWDYVLDEEAVRDSFALTEAPFVVVGHSHVPIVARVAGGAIEGRVAPAGTEAALDGGRLLLNPGSVGQPRDGDPRAAWLLLDVERGQASFRRVEYAVDRTQKEMREAGLPAALIARLAGGV